MKMKTMYSQRIHCEKTRPYVSSEFIIKNIQKEKVISNSEKNNYVII